MPKRRHLPSQPVGAGGAPEVRAPGQAQALFRKALHERHKDHVAAEVTHGQPPAQRQVRKVVAPHAAEDDEAQVHARRREPHHPQGAPTVSSSGTASWRCRVHHQRHEHRHGQRHAALDHGHARDQPPGPNAQRGAAMSLARQPEGRVAGARPAGAQGGRALTRPPCWRPAPGPRQQESRAESLPPAALAPARCRVVRRRAPSPQATVTPSGLMPKSARSAHWISAGKLSIS